MEPYAPINTELVRAYVLLDGWRIDRSSPGWLLNNGPTIRTVDGRDIITGSFTRDHFARHFPGRPWKDLFEGANHGLWMLANELWIQDQNGLFPSPGAAFEHWLKNIQK